MMRYTIVLCALISFMLLLVCPLLIIYHAIPARRSGLEELIIATCSENVDWVDKYAKNYRKITVYNKCGKELRFRSNNIEVVRLSNIGSCDYAFLTYIIDRYDSLPDFMEFTKGSQKPNGKYPVCSLCKNNNPDHRWDDTFYLTDHAYANHKGKQYEEQSWYQSGYKNIRDWVSAQGFLSPKLYETNSCNIIYGGHFGATAEQVRRTPIEDWRQLRAQQKHPREEVDHFIERTWRVLLCRLPYPSNTNPS